MDHDGESKLIRHVNDCNVSPEVQLLLFLDHLHRVEDFNLSRDAIPHISLDSRLPTCATLYSLLSSHPLLGRSCV